MLPFFALVLMAMVLAMNFKVAPVRSTALQPQNTRVETAVVSAVNSVEGVTPEYKQVMLQIMDTSSDN